MQGQGVEVGQALVQVAHMAARQAGDDGQALRGIQHGVVHRVLLGIAQGSGFAGAAQGHQAAHAGLPHARDQPAQGRVVHALAFGLGQERGDQGHPDTG